MLPDNVPLPVLGPTSTGADSAAQPKQAFVVRLSEEVLEILEKFPNNPDMLFEFSKQRTGLLVGDQFFPVASAQEKNPHELYLRNNVASSKAKAPLRLYANVMGKFTVEPTLNNRMQDKVRDRALEAEKQRTDRKAIILDTPPDLTKSKKPRKSAGASTSKTKAPVASTSRSTSSASTTDLKTHPSRIHLLRCLAVASRLPEDAIQLVGKNMTAAAQQDLRHILEDIAEEEPPARRGDLKSRPWCLKPEAWLEVRPYDWTFSSEKDRTTVARKARMKLKDMNIPENDPAWAHVALRSAAGSEIKAKGKESAKGKAKEIQMKNEGASKPSTPKKATTEDLPKPRVSLPKVTKAAKDDSDNSKRNAISESREPTARRKRVSTTASPGIKGSSAADASSGPAAFFTTAKSSVMDTKRTKDTSLSRKDIRRQDDVVKILHPPPENHPSPAESARSSQSQAPTQNQKRRRVDVAQYTSSEDETPPKKQAKAEKLASQRNKSTFLVTLPQDAAGLSTYYDRLYPRYIETYSQLISQKAKFTEYHANYQQIERGSASPPSDLMDLDALSDLKEEQNIYYAELQRIMKARDEL